MHSVLFVFEFLGTTELLVVAVVALILFGPRKLPEIGRTVGRGLAEFKRASDDFKRTWEYEVELESRKPALGAPEAAAEAAAPVAAPGAAAETAAVGAAEEDMFAGASQQGSAAPTVARGSSEAEDVWGVADAPAAPAAEDEGKAS